MISKVKQRLRYIAVDLVTANIVILLFDIMRFYTLPHENIGYFTLKGFLSYHVLLLEQIFLPLLLVLVYGISGFYNEPFRRSRIQEFFTTALTQITNTLFIYFALLTNQATSLRATNILMLLSLYMLLVTVTFVGRWIVTDAMMKRFRSGRSHYNVVVGGLPEATCELAESIRAKSSRTGMHFAGFIADEGTANHYPKEEKVFTLSDLQQLPSSDINEIMLAVNGLSEKQILRELHKLIPLGVPIKIKPDSISALNSNIRLQSIYEEPYVDASTANVSDFTKNVKRLMDIALSLLALLVLSLPMAVIAILVKRDSKGPVFFSQQRIGYRGKPFMIHKFRTMRTDAECAGPRLSCVDDPRVTSIGAVLRKYRLDELPQFWNVLCGDMSLVGPRPERIFFIKQIMEKDPAYALVHLVRPGITSWGMVKYGYASDVEQMVHRLHYDLIYISNMSISVDIKILIYTLKTVIKGRGI